MAANKCSKCGKVGTSGGDSGQIVIATPEQFEDMVGKCESCGCFVCGACAKKEERHGVVSYNCPECGGNIGPG